MSKRAHFGFSSWRHAGDATAPAPLSVTRKQVLEALLTLIAVYAVEWTYFLLVFSRAVPAENWAQPFTKLPVFVFTGWDAVRYQQFFAVYNHYYWPPLYPFALRFIALLCHFGVDSFAKSAALLNIVAHFATILGLLIYQEGRGMKQRRIVWIASFLLFFYPAHNVFFAGYSESTFVALSVWVFILHARGRLASASALAGVAALVRTMGVFLIAAIAAEWVWRCVRAGRFFWRDGFRVLPGLAIALAWHVELHRLGTSVTAENAPWTQELMAVHAKSAENAKIWVIRQLAWLSFPQNVTFWTGIVTILYCARRKRYLEMLYLGAFYSSLLVYVYRPFPWTRFMSALFPIQLMVANWLRDKPRLASVVLIISCATSAYTQSELFQEHIGEP